MSIITAEQRATLEASRPPAAVEAVFNDRYAPGSDRRAGLVAFLADYLGGTWADAKMVGTRANTRTVTVGRLVIDCRAGQEGLMDLSWNQGLNGARHQARSAREFMRVANALRDSTRTQAAA